MHAIEVKELSKTYSSGFWLKPVKVLDAVSFSVPLTGITGFVGHNGSGKTTTIKCLLRLLRADSGKISIFGRETFDAETKKSLGFLPEHPYFQRFLSGEEFLSMHMRLAGLKKETKKINAMLERVGLAAAKDKKLGEYSKGMLQRVGLAQALIHEPKLVILDEPLSGLDPSGRHTFKKILRDVAESGVSLFFSSHMLFDVQELCQNIVVIDQGRTIFQGEIKNLVSTEQKYHLEYRLDQKVFSEEVEDGRIQAEIDRIRRSDGEIIAIAKQSRSLEAAVSELRSTLNA